MPSQNYDIYFAGEIMEGKNPLEVKRLVSNIFKTNQEQLEKLFSGSRVRIKSNTDEETAAKYRVAFRNAGALIEVLPTGSGVEETSITDSVNPSNPAPSNDLTLLPVNTGSLEEYASKTTPQPLPNIEHLSLASAGTTIDESTAPEPPTISIDDLSMGPANSGSLEDCTKEVEPYPIPDISHLDLDKP
ncbi:MAG: hypothetical protein GY814_12820 [Gammaproteobacteria bacterium]|nr:hypothetical protein [Gammaproteobacteria bacterium]